MDFHDTEPDDWKTEEIAKLRKQNQALVRDLFSFSEAMNCNPVMAELLARTAGLMQLELDVADIAFRYQNMKGLGHDLDALLMEVAEMAAARRGR